MISLTRRPVALILVALFIVAVMTFGRAPSLTFAISGFSPNQELPLPLLAPIGPTGVSFIVRGLEPSTRVGPDGAVYVSSIRGVPGGVDLHRYYAPVDGAANPDGTYPFKYEGQPDNCGILANGCANNSLDPLGVGLGGGDVDIAVNYPVTGTPNLALVSLTLAPGITATHSIDRGDHFGPSNPVAALIPGDDRQWLDGFGGQNVYLVYHDAETFQIEVQRSNDGGQTYVDGFGQAIDPQTFPAAGGVPASNSANLLGSIRVDRSACPSNGNLYQMFVAPDNAAENVAMGPLRTAYVGVSTDAKLGLPAFTFTDHKIATTPTSIAQIFPAFAVDRLGNLYAVWSDNSGIYFTTSTDLGTTWATPIRVNQGTTVGKANVFPWIDADANGHVGIVWFGGDRAGDSNDKTIHEPTSDMRNWTNWNVYYAQSVNAHAAAPSFTQSQISDHVIHRGTVSTGGLGGGANRNLGDYFQIAFDPQHRANVAFSDDSKVSPVTVAGHTDPNDPQTRRLIRANFTHELQPIGGIATTGTCAGTQLPPPAGPPATLTLAPKTATNPVGTTHTVTATVKDAFGTPTPGVTVRFTVSGAHSASGTGTSPTNANGQASFSYTETTTGSDSIHAFADTNGNGVQDAGEPFDNATKAWVSNCKPGQEDRGKGSVRDEHGNNGGDFEFDACGENHQVHHRDRDRNVDFESTSGSAPVFDASAPTATSTGQGLNNGLPVTYTLVVTDLGAGPGTDIYSLTLSDSSGVIYLRTGTLLFGDLVVRR